MRVVLVEFPWHVKKILNDRSSFDNDVIVSLHAESSYILRSNKIKYFETYNFCIHSELWAKYKELTEKSLKITNILDKALWSLDNRFNILKWNFFNDYHYPIKISFDQLFYYSELISKLIEKYNPSEIIVCDSKKVLVNSNFLIDSKTSIIKYLLKTLKGSSSKIKISYVFDDFEKKKILPNIKDLIKKKIKNIFYQINFWFNYYTTKPKYLSIGSVEVLKYKKLYPSQSKFFLSFFQENLSKKKNKTNLIFFNKFIDYLKNKTNFYEIIKYKDISFELIFNEILFKFIQQLDFLFYEYNKANKIICRIKPKCVIFDSMRPFSSAAVAFRKNCIDQKIPYAVWSHGGHGLTYSFTSYDVTDFRLSKYHISFGNYLNDLLADKDNILHHLGFRKDQKIFPVGSARLDYDNKKKILRKNLKKNNKPTILFISGLLYERNSFYFGRNREKSETSIWEFHHDIFLLLKKYQNKYNIIFKDYPNRKRNLWKRILKDIKADNILYVSSEYNVNHLLRKSDLNIMPWISTTFFEALYFNADIFVMEEDLFEKPFKNSLKNEIFYYKNNKIFLSDLEKYLEKGNFYTLDKKNSQNYFLKYDHINKRDLSLNESLSKII